MKTPQNEPFLLAEKIPSLFFHQTVRLWYDDFTGEFYPPEKPIYNSRMHPSYSLHYVIEGHGYFGTGDDDMHYLSPGDMFFIPAKEIMRYYPCRKSPWKYCGISLDGTEASVFFGQLHLQKPTLLPHSTMTDQIGHLMI